MLVSMPEEAYEAILGFQATFNVVKGKLPGSEESGSYLSAVMKMIDILTKCTVEDYSMLHDRPNGEK